MKIFLGCNDSRAAVHAILERKKPLQFIYFYTGWDTALKRTQKNVTILGMSPFVYQHQF